MRYSGIECVLCGNTFSDTDDVVVCPVCGAPHHRVCWAKENRCACTDKHAEGFVWEFPKKEQQPEQETSKPQTIGNFMFKNGEGVIICPNCKTPNFENDMFCRRCQTPLKQNGENENKENINTQYSKNTDNTTNGYTDVSPDNSSNEGYNQYREASQNAEYIRDSINRFGGLNPESTIDSIPVIEYSDYIGTNKPGKIIRKISLMERYGKNVLIHWPPILFGHIWFFYRKMKKEGIIFSLILLIFSLLCGLFNINQPYVEYAKETFSITESCYNGEISYEDAMEQLSEAEAVYYSTSLTTEETIKNYIALFLNYACTLGIPLVCSALALKLYRKKIKTDIFRIRQECSDMPTYRNKLISTGGISIGLTAIGVIIYVLAALIRTYLPLYIAVTFM